jgi:RimJ/RimL family protein N-acetyltransferase
MATVRVLRAGDEMVLETFLARHADSTMFLRSNLRVAGIVDRGRSHEATYVAAFARRAVVGVAAHGWNGDLVLQAPVLVAELAGAAAAASSRPVDGLIGPWEQALAARTALGLDAVPAQFAQRQELFALDLDDLRVPPALTGGRLRCRRPVAADVPLLVAWRAAYRREAFNSEDRPDLLPRSRQEVEAGIAGGAAWVLEDGDRLVAYQQFNARLPDAIQVGGVWTPPDLRGRGYARAVVAGSLLAVGAEGIRRAVLFTDDDNAPAQRAYLALGFERVGDYGIILLARPNRA